MCDNCTETRLIRMQIDSIIDKHTHTHHITKQKKKKTPCWHQQQEIHFRSRIDFEFLFIRLGFSLTQQKRCQSASPVTNHASQKLWRTYSGTVTVSAADNKVRVWVDHSSNYLIMQIVVLTRNNNPRRDERAEFAQIGSVRMGETDRGPNTQLKCRRQRSYHKHRYQNHRIENNGGQRSQVSGIFDQYNHYIEYGYYAEQNGNDESD